MGSTGTTNNPNVISLVHYTPEENVGSIMSGGFNLDYSGEGAGTAWGNGVYFLEKGSYEDDMYSSRLNTESYIKSNIDTTGFLRVDTLENRAYRGVGKLFDDAAKSFNKPLHREYTSLKNQFRREGEHRELANKKAFTEVARRYYPGVIVRHRTENGYIDPISGGNQVVVYDTSRILNRTSGRN